MSLRWVKSGAASLAVEVDQAAGAAGASLVLLHAGVGDRRMWQPQVEALSGRHPLVRYDRRGFGETRVDRPEAYAQVDDLQGVMDACGLQRAVLIGCSQGGRIALDAALAVPQRVQGLVLVAPAISGAPEATALSAPEQALSDAIDAASEAGDVDRVNELEARLWLDGALSEPGRVQGAVRELFLEMNGIALRAADPGKAAEPPSAWARLQEVRVPTLVIWGDLDLLDVQARCEQLVRVVPGAQGVKLPGTAHLPGLEAPAAFNPVLQRFLEGF